MKRLPHPKTGDELELDAAKAKELVSYLKEQDQKIQGLLLWSSISVLVGFIAVIFGILRCYVAFGGEHQVFMAFALIVIYALFGAYLWVQFRISAYQPKNTLICLKELYHFKKQKTKTQLSFLVAGLITYTLIVLAACMVCCWDATGTRARQIFIVTMPLSIFIYLTGLYLLALLGRRWQALTACINAIDKQLLQRLNQQ